MRISWPDEVDDELHMGDSNHNHDEPEQDGQQDGHPPGDVMAACRDNELDHSRHKEDGDE
jgi:hypothetical protein